MSWRTVVIKTNSKLDLKLGYLEIRRSCEDIKKIFIGEIYMLVIETTAVSITSSLLCELTKQKVKVIFCDEKRNPISTVLPYYGSFDTSLKVKKQINWKIDTKELVWTEIIREKISNQYKLLDKLGYDESALLSKYILEIQRYDKTNREGHAAKVYFNALFGKGISRSDENPVNSALNYGYGILLSAFSREIVCAGYITQLGLFHDNMYNDYNFASDLMEPFRPLIDELVFSDFPNKFDHVEKMKIIDILNKEVYIAGKKQFVSNAIKIYSKSVFDALNNDDLELIKFFNEL